MSFRGGVDQQFVSCSQCNGLFTRRKTLLHHKTNCDGNPESSKCDFYAVPFAEYTAWKNARSSAKKLGKEVNKVEKPMVMTETTRASPKRPSSAPEKDNKPEESPAKIPRRRGRPRKILPPPEPNETSTPSVEVQPEAIHAGKDSQDNVCKTAEKAALGPEQSEQSEVMTVSLDAKVSTETPASEAPKSVSPSKLDDSKESPTKVDKNRESSNKVDDLRETSSSTPVGLENNVSIGISGEQKEIEVTKTSQTPESSPKKEGNQDNPQVISNENSEAIEEQKPLLVKVPWEAAMDDDRESLSPPHPVVIAQVMATGNAESDAEMENSIKDCDDPVEHNTEIPHEAGADELTKDSSSVNNTSSPKPVVIGRKRNAITQYECGICVYKTKLHGMFVRHMQSHNYGDRFTCDLCGKIFIHRRHFNTHMMTHNRLKCPHCEKMYSRTHDRDRHIKNTHSDEKLLYSCNMCNFATPYPGNFKEHQRKHTGERLCCTKPGCEYKTLYQRALRHHVNSVHATSRDFKCTLCPYRSSTKLGLTKHMASHSVIRDKQCPHCAYTAKTTGSLRAHILKHESEKYYYCDQCTYKTFRAHSFRNHMLIHLGLKPWHCGSCNFDAVTKEKVVRHVTSKHGGVSKNGQLIRRKDIRVKLNLEAFRKDPNNVEEVDQSYYDSSKTVMIEVINESGENVQANFSSHHQVILNEQRPSEEIMEQSLPSDLTDQQAQDIYKCAMCAFQADNLGDVEEHINEAHGSVAGEEIVMNIEEGAVDAFDISQENIEIHEATEQEVEEMVYVIAPGSEEEQSLIIQSKSNEIQDDAVFTAVESILHLQNAPEGGTSTVTST